MRKPGEQLPTSTPEEIIQAELGQSIYERAEELRLRALASVGLSEETLGHNQLYRVTLKTSNHRVKVEIGKEYQINVGWSDLRSIAVSQTHSEEPFEYTRYTEQTGAMWQMADSSQGEPWYPAQPQTEVLAKMLSCLDELAVSHHWVEVTLLGYQQAVPQESAA